MINTSLEITESEYLIKLNRSKFNLSFIRSLLKIVEVSDRSEEEELSYGRSFDDDAQSSNADYYSHLDEK
jgi:hypothetical protein